MKADELKVIAADWLRLRFPEAHILYEFSLAEYGGALIDVGAVCGDQIVGVEIKGDGDSPSRLKLQGQMYSRVCRQVYLLAAPSIEDKCQKNRPPEWKPLFLDEESGGIRELLYVADRIGNMIRGAGYGLAPTALAAMVWASEYSAFYWQLRECGAPFPAYSNLPKRKADTIKYVSETCTLPTIEKAVCAVLRERVWDNKKVMRPMQVTS